MNAQQGNKDITLDPLMSGVEMSGVEIKLLLNMVLPWYMVQPCGMANLHMTTFGTRKSCGIVILNPQMSNEFR